MMNLRLATGIVLALTLLAACSSHRYTVVDAPRKPLTDYEVLEIPTFDSHIKTREGDELAIKFAGRLMKEIAEYREKHPDQVIYRDVVNQTSEVNDVLVMNGTVLSYEEGDRAKRYFLGMGAGKAFCTIQIRFTDKATGEELAVTNFDGELSGGIFGGNSDEAVDGAVKAFLDYMDHYMDRG